MLWVFRQLVPALILLLGWSGCASVIHDGEFSAPKKAPQVFLIPIENATSEEHAGEAMTAMVGSALVERGWVVHTPPPLSLDAPPYTEQDYVRLAAERQCVTVLRGSVHEFRYKTDLNGHPAAGLTLSSTGTKDGTLLWQGTASNVGFSFSSLTSAAQYVARKLVDRIPDVVTLPLPPVPTPPQLTDNPTTPIQETVGETTTHTEAPAEKSAGVPDLQPEPIVEPSSTELPVTEPPVGEAPAAPLPSADTLPALPIPPTPTTTAP